MRQKLEVNEKVKVRFSGGLVENFGVMGTEVAEITSILEVR